MPRIAFLLLAILIPCSAFGQLPYIPIVQSSSSAVNSTTNTCILGRNATAGNYSFVSFNWETSTNTPTVTDSQGNTYTQKLINTGNNVKVAVYTATFGSSAADTITVAITGGAWLNIECSEVLPTFSLTTDVSNTGVVTSGTPATVTSGSVTTTLNNDFIYCHAGGFSTNGVLSAVLPFTMATYSSGADSGGAEFKVAGNTGSESCTFNNQVNTEVTVAIIAFKSNALAIQTPATLPDAALSNTYKYTFLSTGGNAALTWSVSFGSLPSGLSISGAVLSGTPLASSNNSFTIQVTDGTSTVTLPVTLKVTTGLNTPTIVQSKNDGGSQNSTTLAYTSNVTSGNVLVIGGGIGPGSPGLPRMQYCTDSLGTVFRPMLAIDYIENGGRSTIILEILVGVAPSSGADTVTCSADTGIAAIFEISNTQFFGNENFSVLSGSPATSTISSSLTTIVPNEMIVTSGAEWNSATTATLQAPFTRIGAGLQTDQGYRAVSTVTSYTANYATTGTLTTGWAIAMLGLRPASNGTVTPSGTQRHKGQIL